MPRPYKLTDNNERDIVRLYQKGKNTYELADIFPACQRTILKVLYKFHVPIRYRKKLNENQEKEICQSYLKNESVNNLVKKFFVSNETIYKTLKKFKVKCRTTSESLKSGCDENFFNEIDSEEKSYWLGFLTADGNVYKERLSLSLQSRDKEHLEKFKKSISSKHSINKKNSIGTAFGIAMRSKKLTSDLKKLGVVERKSLIIKPAKIKESFQNHYWRGLIDGDGCISIHKRKTFSYPVISLVGTKWICNGFSKFVSKFIQHKSSIRSEKNIASISFGKRKVVKAILEHLYKNSEVYLDRKYDKYKLVTSSF